MVTTTCTYCRAAVLLGLLLAEPISAAVIHVPSQRPTIQAGIDAASAGDTVLVAPGTYTGPSNRDLSFGGRDLVLLSSGGMAVTIIDCQSQGRGVVFQNGEAAASVVEGFTIQNGLAGGTFGGAILIEGGATPTIQYCRFVSNHANVGGGIYVVNSGATLSRCEFEGNTADNYGGGVYGMSAVLELEHCAFMENGAGIGAGMFVWSSSTARLTDCDFTENVPLNLGGGLYGLGSSLTFQRCSFVGNTGNVGAGAYLEGGAADVDSCAFRVNTANHGGGGLYAKQVEGMVLARCTFEGNTALGGGPALTNGGGGLRAEGPTTIDLYAADCTFIGNRALGQSDGSGGGVFGGGGDAVVERCSFIDNHADHSGGGHNGGGLWRECVFEGNTAGRVGGGLRGGSELIDCRFTYNHAGIQGGGAEGISIVIRCDFSGNSAGDSGGGLRKSGASQMTVEDSRFFGNHAPSGGGLRVYAYSNQPVSFTGCTFERNTGFHEGGAAIIQGPTENPPPVTLSGCSLVGNGSPMGAGGLNLGIPVEIENTIIAFGSEGEAITCSDMGVGVISCTDIYGNAGGDWTGCISDQLGINGNFSADPLFCNMGGGDYTLAETSPCAPEHSPAGCGLIGAFPVACVNPIGVAVEGAPPVVGRLRVTPNPMRESGVIQWVSQNAVPVSLRLYDPLGRLVTSRFLGLMPEGRQELRWDGLVGERRLPPGVYMLELGGPSGGVDRSRVVLIR